MKIMKSVNYYVLGEIFSLLERTELIDDITFGDYDPDDHSDVEEIVRRFIEPSVRQARPCGQDAILAAIAYYSLHESAPFQLMKDRCQELTLPDADSWPTFFHWIGLLVFGDDYRERLRFADVNEVPDEKSSETILRRA